MSSGLDDYITDDIPASRWSRPATWSALLLAGWLVYEITAQPALAGVTICLKFGWNDFLTGRWLRRTDPDRRRGLTCFWLYTSSGLWKISVAGAGIEYAGALVDLLFNRQAGLPAGNGLAPSLKGAVITSACSLGLAVLGTLLALTLAWRRGLKLWLHPSIHRSRRKNLWPPDDSSRSHTNRAKWL